MPQQTRKTILNRVRSYLRQNPDELKGVRGFHRNRLEGLIQRLDAFSPIETLRWNVPDRALFREIALSAGIQFVRQYPFLYHTPNTLRSLFGMPTRTDRKKGRYSSIFYRNEAIERQLRPRLEHLNQVQENINLTTDPDYQELLPTLNKYIKRARNRKYAEDLIEPPESDHSEESIDGLRQFLIELGFKDLQEASDMKEEQLEDLYGVILAPDMIGKWKEIDFWIELKEYHGLKFNSKVIFQVFRYLYHTPHVILMSISPLPAFSELINQDRWTSDELFKWGKEKESALNKSLNSWTNMRKVYQEFGRTLKLNTQQEALLLALTNEIVTREIGLVSTELRGIEKFLDLITKFKQPIIIMNLDEFLEKEDKGKEIPQPLLLLKMNFKQ